MNFTLQLLNFTPRATLMKGSDTSHINFGYASVITVVLFKRNADHTFWPLECHERNLVRRAKLAFIIVGNCTAKHFFFDKVCAGIIIGFLACGVTKCRVFCETLNVSCMGSEQNSRSKTVSLLRLPLLQRRCYLDVLSTPYDSLLLRFRKTVPAGEEVQRLR